MLTHCRSKVPSWAMLLLAGLLSSPVAKAAGEPPQLDGSTNNEAVAVTPKSAYGANLVAKVYSVFDLIVPRGDFPMSESASSSKSGGTALTKQTPLNTTEAQLIKLITSTIAPQSWTNAGGPAKIEYVPLGNTLLIHQTPEAHAKIADLLAFLRRERGQTVSVEVRFISVPECFFERIGLDFSAAIKNKGKSPQAILSDIQVYLLLAAVQGDRRTKITQTPHLTLFNGETATVAMQDHQLFVTNFEMGQENGRPVFKPQNQDLPTGMTLTVQGVISSDRRSVSLAIQHILTSMTSAKVPVFPITAAIAPSSDGFDDGKPITFTNYIQQPAFNTINVQASATLPDGGTLLIAGPRRLSENRIESGPAMLSKIPYVGGLFTHVEYDWEVLLVMATARIVNDSEQEPAKTAPPVARASGSR